MINIILKKIEFSVKGYRKLYVHFTKIIRVIEDKSSANSLKRYIDSVSIETKIDLLSTYLENSRLCILNKNSESVNYKILKLTSYIRFNFIFFLLNFYL